MAAVRILGRTAFVALFIFTLVVVAFAQDPAQTPTLIAKDQAAINDKVTIEQVTVPQQAFLVIQRDLAGAAGSILGRVALQTGTTENVVVPLDAAVAPGDQLYAVLYVDAALIGVFETPGADTPFLVNNQPVAQPFTIAAESELPAQATGQPTQTQQAQPTAQPTVQPTITVTALVTIPVNLTAATTPTVPLVVSATLTSTPQPITQTVAQPTALPTTQPITQAVTQTGTQPITQVVAQPTSPLPTPPPSTPTPTLVPALQPTVEPTNPQPTPTQIPTQTSTTPPVLQQPSQPRTPTPALMPTTGANGATNLPVTLSLGALTLILFAGGDRIRQRWRRRAP